MSLGNWCKCVLLVILVQASATADAQGLFSGLFGGKGDDAAQQPPPQQQQQQGQQQPGAPPNMQSVKLVEGQNPNAKPKPTPTKAEIRAGAAKLQQQMGHEKIPADLFNRYHGNWTGWFWTYSPDGKTEGVQSVRIQCEANANGLQAKAMYFDRIAQQFVVGEEYTYQKVDAMTVKVTIKRATNETATQTGHYKDGSLFLQGNISDGVESYRERIDGKSRWLMDGFSSYDNRGNKKGRDAHHHVARLTKDK